jgi:hypothetical protein
LLTGVTRSPCQERFYCLDSTRSAGTCRLIVAGGCRDGGGDAIDEESSDYSLFGA